MANFHTHWVVRNTTGSSRYVRRCGCTSWFRHWWAATASKRTMCARLSCSEIAVDGAHVQIMDGRSTQHWYIVPFCASCNRSKHRDWMYLKRDVVMVPISQSDTCRLANSWPRPGRPILPPI